MEFSELTEYEFQNFVDTCGLRRIFFQTVMMKKKLECDGVKVYLVGVKEKGKVIGASLIAKTKHIFLGKAVYEAYKGFGGYVEELLGAYEIILSPVCFLYNALKKIRQLLSKR